MSNKYLLYKHTSPSGKSYIGITNDYNRRCTAHQHNKLRCPAFYAAIQKYGWDNFTHDILYSGLTKEDACKLEQQMIIDHNTRVPNGYNLTSGGEIFEHHQSSKDKISKANKGRKRVFTEEHRAKLSAALKGRKLSKEHVQHIQDAKCQSDRSHTEETKAKISKSKIGHIVSQETKDKIAATRRLKNL